MGNEKKNMVSKELITDIIMFALLAVALILLALAL
jgi:hypothetical protein